ncbi:hypothetical protein niasHT_015145 [Heterodera trifolii]|uniref:Annexin n=1 Tax=Heterodera trifolii TaxID=157864 RepID=A0ABD2L9T3_9BILA
MVKNSLIITVLLVLLITAAVMMIGHCVAANIGPTINANPKFDANLAAIVTQIICSIDNQQDAMKLIKESKGQKSINESVFNEVIATRNLVQLRLTFDFYCEVADQDIEMGIKQEFGGDDEAGFLALIKCVRNSSEYFADLLQNSINGPVISELELIRLVVSRSEIDLADIKHAYLEMHHISLKEAIEANTNGAFGEALLALVKGNQ